MRPKWGTPVVDIRTQWGPHVRPCPVSASGHCMVGVVIVRWVRVMKLLMRFNSRKLHFIYFRSQTKWFAINITVISLLVHGLSEA